MSRRWASRQSLEKFCDRNSLGNKDSLVVVVNTIDVRSSALKIYVYNVHKYITVGEILVKSIQERELCCFEMEEIKESADGLHEPVSINGKLGIPFPRTVIRWTVPLAHLSV
uniref:DUF5641 domain-containing protein n=1 Tax=Ascaris lumbricoides TaxID=6252 RepID=A0A0M3HP48_ASCLU